MKALVYTKMRRARERTAGPAERRLRAIVMRDYRVDEHRAAEAVRLWHVMASRDKPADDRAFAALMDYCVEATRGQR